MLRSWLETLFGTKKPIIAMVHFPALPGDPLYSDAKGIGHILEVVGQDVYNLQEGGVDAIMFSNENSRPYLAKVGPETIAVMARVIAQLLDDIEISYGVDVLWDPIAAIALAKAIGGSFVREVFTGAYAGDLGLWNTNCGETLRYRHSIDADDVRLFSNIYPESAASLASRPIEEVAKTAVFNTLPDAICISGATAGMDTSTELLRKVKGSLPEVPVFVNTGVRLSNVEGKLSIADGAVVGTALKVDGVIWNAVDLNRVKSFMAKVREIRSK